MRTLLLAAAIASAGFAPAPFLKPAAPRSVLEALQGSWRRTTYTNGGTPISLAMPHGPPVHLVIEGNVMTYTQGADVTHGVWDFTLDEKAKPVVIRLKWRKAADGHEGVLKIEGDTLTLCTSYGGVKAGDFDPNVPGRYFSVFKRALKGAK